MNEIAQTRKAKLFAFTTVILSSILITACSSGGGSSGTNSSAGIAGSQARFNIVDNYLYTISGANIQLYDITDAANPVPHAKVFVDWAIETIFPYQDTLFIGGQLGVYIYDNSDPSNPQFISEFSHASSCDPVVVENNVAYVTLSAGSICNRGLSQMDILDVSNIESISHIKTVALQNPTGLGVDKNRLFVCDDIAGLKIFDLTDPFNPQQIRAETDLNCYDVITNDGVLIVSDQTGVLQYQYSYSSADFQRLGFIPVHEISQ
jgi:hypothetical protein